MACRLQEAVLVLAFAGSGSWGQKRESHGKLRAPGRPTRLPQLFVSILLPFLSREMHLMYESLPYAMSPNRRSNVPAST